ncbi:MAG: ABC transporter ATP-binding protein [Anaerolineales bacterium]|jgi:ATP-binding cassette subfamily B protein
MTDHQFEEEEFSSQHTGRTLVRILSLAKPHWYWVLGFIIAISLVSIMDAYFTYLSKQIIDEGILTGDKVALRWIVTRYGILIVIQALAVFSFIYMAGLLGERIRYDLRKKMFNHLQKLSLSYYNKTPVGWIMSRVTSDSERVAELVTWGFLDMTWGIMNIFSAGAFMIAINWQLALIVLTIIPILILVAAQFQKRIILQYRNVRKINSKITGSYNENITGVRVVKAFGREDKNMDEFKQETSEMYRAGYRAAWFSALFFPTVQLISSVALASIIWFGGYQAQIGNLSIGGIQAFVSYVVMMIWPIQELARVYAEMQNSIASAERIFSLVDAVPDITDQPGAFDPGTIQGDIIFENVNFAYEEDDLVLHDFNLHVKRGETIALVGPTGGGKSTIVNLLCRFFEPTSGSICIGGQEYRQLSLKAIQSRIGIVLQTPHLFSGSIRENIRYGNLSASDTDIENAAKLAGAHDFIVNFDKGYNDEVGEGGNMLSVGQKQLISLSRAVLRQPEIFIMDEATSSVDTITEALIQKGMENLMKGRTSFVIAHRLSTIKNADRILVIKDGAITEMGNHAELIRKHGHYYRLYTSQFRNQLEQEYAPLETATSSAT